MATKKTTNQLPVPGMTTLPVGQPFYVYTKGADAFENFKLNGEAELVLDDGTTKTGKVTDKRVAPLIELMIGTGSQSAAMASRIYSPLALVEALTEASGDEVLDVTKLYTAVAVQIQVAAPTIPVTTTA